MKPNPGLTKPIRVVLVDDHTLVRSGIRRLVEEFAGFEVIAEASDGREAVRLARQLLPEIALLDIAMPGLNGLDATALITKGTPQVKVVVLSMHADEHYVLEALRAGALGYVVKSAAVDELELALRTIMSGERWLSAKVSHHVLEAYLRLTESNLSTAQQPTLLDALTPRQREILQLIAESRTTREMAERLFVSARTIESHRAQIMARLNIHDVAGLTRFAIRNGLVDPLL